MSAQSLFIVRRAMRYSGFSRTRYKAGSVRMIKPSWIGGRPDAALVRDYCLDDPQWISWATGQMQTVVRRNRKHDPLAYDIRDELSTTISANPFDYHFNPIALASFREWLKTQYAGLPSLNAEWQTTFQAWDDVKPFTTDQIKNRLASGEALPGGKPDWQQLPSLLKARRCLTPLADTTYGGSRRRWTELNRTGVFDDHVRLRAAGPFDASTQGLTSSEPRAFAVSSAGRRESRVGDVAGYSLARLKPDPSLAFADWMREQL